MDMKSTTPRASAPKPRSAAHSRELERHWFEHVYAGDHVPQLTLRAVVMGTIIGCVMAFSNLYVGLKTGWGLNVAITACIISYTVFPALPRRLPVAGAQAGREAAMRSRPAGPGRGLNPREQLHAVHRLLGRLLHRLASSLPSRPTYDHRPPPALLDGGGLVLGPGLLGVFLAVPGHEADHDRRGAVTVPVGTAAAETLRSLHQAGAEARKKARGLFTAMGLGAVIGWFRDGIPALIPNYLPISQLFESSGSPAWRSFRAPPATRSPVEAPRCTPPRAP